METRVTELLGKKGNHVITIDRGALVSDAVTVMVANRVGSVVVIDDSGVCGIFSERDCVVRVVLERREPRKTCVADVMTPNVNSVTMGHSVEACMNMMTKQRCRHLPVMTRGVLVGLISIGDCVAHLSAEATRENADLLDYIAGRYPG
jgi:signal-transduction protein with cAMP-binding, CBS, and nucleotidyltransferase domain